MQKRLPFSVYDAFSAGGFGGATAGIVSDAASLSPDLMQSIAREVAAPATAFLLSVSPTLIEVRFFSTLTEYGMCGHGTVALATLLIETEQLAWGRSNQIATTLRTRDGDAPLTIRRAADRALVMLELNPSTFEPATVDIDALARVLGIAPALFDDVLPIEKAIGDFTHLVVPVRDLDAIRKITPDFSGIAAYSRGNNVQTVTVFTLEVEQPGSTLHCRDFCPAVGTPESPAAGTTNAALTSYLVRHKLIEPAHNGPTAVFAEQGYECGRPSQIRSELTLSNDGIDWLAVGGTARKSISGEIFLPA